MGMFEKLIFYLQYPFVRNALIVGVLIALCSSLLGITLVLKRYSFIGDGLSHVAFGAVAVATVMGFANTSILVMPVTILVAVFLLKSSRKRKIKGDAIVAVFSVGAMAIGYLLMNVFSSSANISADVCSTLFGSTAILTLSRTEVLVCILASIVVVFVFILYYHKIFAITFDEEFFKAIGVKTERYNLLLAVIIAVIIVIGMNLVGSLLISALVVFPALSAMRIVENFKGVVLLSAVISVCCAFAGLIFSILYSTPVGSTIVLVNIILFLLSLVVGRLRKV